MHISITDHFFEQTMIAVAHRIAVQAKINPQAAANDFEQHAREMTDAERADFQSAIVQFAIESE